MALRSNTCPKCGGRMAQGYMVDFADSGGRKVASWVEGEPQRGWFKSVILRGHRRIEVESWRCEKCGYLENYAAEPRG